MTVVTPATGGRRSRLFIDYWNFQLSWNDVIGKAPGRQCDWRQLPLAITNAAGGLLAGVGLAGPLELEETLLYASVDVVTGADTKLRGWLEGTIDRLPSYRVNIRERQAQRRSLYCRNCGKVTAKCADCETPFVASVEKGVDTAIVTDLLTLAWQQAYDVAVLVTSDADFVPAVERIQERGLKVVNAGWKGKGHELKKACWASFDLDAVGLGVCR